MSCPLVWPTVTWFYPVGNTSAVCLTEHLPPESKADILLLACGDPRHILYTIHVEETNPLTRLRTFDITCCDVDVAILARNALLYTLLADDGTPNKLNSLWNLVYHMFVDRASLSILSEQCRKLVALAESLDTWRAGPYGHFLTTCNAATLSGLRRTWSAYLNVATFSSQKVNQFERSFVNGMEKKRRLNLSTAARSVGPLALYADEAISRQFSSYWSLGITEDSVQGQARRRHLKVNPMFAFSLHGDEFALHYAIDPLCGFHLVEAFASGKFTRPHARIPPHELVRVAKNQFSRWCTSLSKRLKNSNPSSPTFVVRMFAGDALMFCQALKYCEVMQSPVTPYNIAAWRLSTITLDNHYYGRNAVSSAPLSFNIIDTSNISDHVGLVNLIVVTTPLLRKIASATLYTEALHKLADKCSQADLEHVCGDLPTMALLLGIIPSTFMSQFTTRSNAHETLFHERLAWKVVGFGGAEAYGDPGDLSTPNQRLFFPSEALASFLFRVYLQMFSDEDMESKFQQISLPYARQMQVRSELLSYNRRSFALLVHFVKTRVQTDWRRTMARFEELVMADNRLLTGQHAYQELCCQLHLLEVYSSQMMSISELYSLHPADAGLFHDWTRSRIPHVVTLVLVVPRDAIAALESDFREIGTPILQCDMLDPPFRVNYFAVTSATLGSLRVSGTGEYRAGVIIEGNADQDALVPGTRPPWQSQATLIVTFSIPSISIADFGRNPESTVGLALRATPTVASKFASRLGLDLTVFRAKLRDRERVFVLAQTPVVGTGTSTGAGAGVATASHWHEDQVGDAHPEQAARNSDQSQGIGADVHVQMNDKSSAAQSLTLRVDVTKPDARAALADKQIIPTVHSSSGSTRSLDSYLKIGEHVFSLRFPLPVDAARAKLRVARRSSYVEVVAPLALFGVRSERDLSDRFAPLSLNPGDDGTPMLGSIHRLHLDRCPTFKLPKGSSGSDWLDLHISHMFSEFERGQKVLNQNESSGTGSSASGLNSNTFLHVKQTLALLLRSAAGATRDSRTPEKVFLLCDQSRDDVPYLYIVVACMRLDVGSHTVAADAFVALGTPAVRAVLGTTEDVSQKPDDSGIQRIATDADETAAWFLLLPRLTERCRTWPHQTNCAYRTLQHQERTPGEESPRTQDRRSSLCACGLGVGTEILPKTFKQATPYLTRAAFSPFISVPYLEALNVPAGSTVDSGTGRPSQEATTRPTPSPLRNRNAGIERHCRSCGKEGGLTCSRCKRARYCSEACQRADWRDHKKNCGAGSATERASG